MNVCLHNCISNYFLTEAPGAVKLEEAETDKGSASAQSKHFWFLIFTKFIILHCVATEEVIYASDDKLEDCTFESQTSSQSISKYFYQQLSKTIHIGLCSFNCYFLVSYIYFPFRWLAEILAIMNEHNIFMEGRHTSARMPDEYKSTEPQVVIPKQEFPPPDLHQMLFDELPSVEDELGHLYGEAGEIPRRKSIDKREKPPAEALAKQLNLLCDANTNQPKAPTGLKRTNSTSQSGPKSAKKPKEFKPKALKNLIPKVEEWDLMPELGINELRRKYKVTIGQNLFVSVN